MNIACRAWSIAQEVIKSLALPPVYLDPRFDKCWCNECMPNAMVPIDPLASPSPSPLPSPHPSPPTSRRGSVSNPSVTSPSTTTAYASPTIAMAPLYKLSGSDDQRYTLPYGYVEIGLRVDPRFKAGHQVRVWDEWNACYFGIRCDTMDTARVTLTSILTGSLARPGNLLS
jgi:hypothetical protein